MEFRLLGPLQVEADGRDLTPRRPRERAVLGFLLLRHPRAVSVDELLDAIWGEAPPATARTALHGLISALRRALGAERIETDASGYRFRLVPGDHIDIARFERLIEDAAAAPPSIRAAVLREALDLVRGEPFGDVEVAIDLHPEVARLEGLRLAAEESQIAAELELGRHREVLGRLERLVAEQPLREGLRGQLILALYRSGRQADALRVAQDARTILATELGVEPGPVLQRLERQVLEQDPALLAERSAIDQAPPPVLGGGPATFLAVRAAHGNEPVLEDVTDMVVAHGGAAVRLRRGTVFAFARAREAAVAGAAIQRAARRAGEAVRIGLHSGTTTAVAGTDGPAPAAEADHATRIAVVAHPGQIVLSRTTRDLLREAALQELDVRDLGDHRLSDLAPARSLHQLVAPGLPVDFPPTRGLDDAPTNLPVQATPLVGREVELDQVTALLRDPGVRLVTLTGPAGTGKTRLALHAAAALLEDAPYGIWFVPLEALGDADLAPSVVASTLGVIGEGTSALGAIAQELGDRRAILVLDNFEHLLDAAGFVTDLLEAATGATVLVTSRAPLKVPLERVVAVPPLPLPPETVAARGGLDVAALMAVGSVALFTARAAAVRPEFTLTPEDAGAVAQLCRALDGLPLAIELAASRVGLMSPGAVLQRLDRPLQLLTARRSSGSQRHQALETAIDWSHDLLEPDAQRLFANLAVFAGGWTLEAAEDVCGSGVDVVDGLAGLVDHSLVRLGGSDADPRFGMLETIRKYASARLDASGRRAQLERAHASFLVSLAEAAEPHLRGSPGPWLARLEIEQDNVRAALDRLASNAAGPPDDAGTEARLAGAMWRFWYLAGHLHEGRARLEHALSTHRDPTPARVKALIGASVMAINTEDAGAASQRALEAMELSRAIGDPWSAAYAEFMLGNAVMTRDADGARRHLAGSMDALRELGDEHSALLAARSLAGALLDMGDLSQASAQYEDILRRARAGGNGRLEASTLGALATIAFDAGRVTDATLLLRESLRLHRELGDRLDTAVDLARAARTLAMGGRPVESAQVLGAVSAMRAGLGVRGHRVAAMAGETQVRLRRQLPSDALDRNLQEGSRLRAEAAIELALSALA
jgi:predicted ATPase/DNA-binding SARP family transcriptional activator